ncbi:acyl-CoA dehydrogenase [candidate division WOR-3 bacterium 4484_100]|uniref:Acyl-CoA dehydrogenase n=1 Tax=candidate division WOR-3 bacterium 4484_100 TaxID=1936077 RepID=A0A1V4QDZ3_UNCW3|nr:MAG: acyl-CoA dehydrogenase [candidate division WOR-3 bacterium 4484_100]
MNFDLTNDQKMLQDQVRKFAQTELAPVAPELDKSGEFPWENLKKMAKLGLLGIIVPEEYGGSGFDFVSLAIAIEEISRVCATTGVIVAVNNSLTTYPILQFGTEEQKKKYLPPLCSGEKIGAIGITEPNAGSDVAAMESTARLEGDYYILNGTKRFITNGGEAGIFVVFAYTNKELKHKGISAFIVEKGTPGFTLGKHEDLMGIRATANCELIFEDCKIPKENLLGEEGQGFKICMNTLDVSRIDIGAQAVGIAQGALDEAVKYSKERKAFGQPICNFEMIQSMLAEMATQIHAARLMVYYAGYCKDKGMKRFSKEAAMAKYYASSITVDVTRKALQIHGGYGYTKDYAIERLYRDAKILELYEGTSEIQKIVIARELIK